MCLVVHGLEERVGEDAIVAVHVANHGVGVEHTQRVVEVLQALLDSRMPILCALVTYIIISAEDITLMVVVLFLGLIRQ